MGLVLFEVGTKDLYQDSSSVCIQPQVLENLSPGCSLSLIIGWLWPNLSFSLVFSSIVSTLTFLLKSYNFSSFIKFVALRQNSFRSATGFLNKLFAKCPGLKIVTIWCKATSRLRLWIFKATFWISLGRVLTTLLLLDVCQCNRCKTIWLACHKLHLKLGHQHAERLNWKERSLVNQLSVSLFKDVGNIWHCTTCFVVYRLI